MRKCFNAFGCQSRLPVLSLVAHRPPPSLSQADSFRAYLNFLQGADGHKLGNTPASFFSELPLGRGPTGDLSPSNFLQILHWNQARAWCGSFKLLGFLAFTAGSCQEFGVEHIRGQPGLHDLV